MIYNVSDFGAQAKEGFNSSPAFQAAIDAAVKNGGGTIKIPPSGIWPNYYWLMDPVYLNGDNIQIEGSGSKNTKIITWGPAFTVSRHPELWTTKEETYYDTDTKKRKNIKDNTGKIDFSPYKVDLYRFTNSGDLKNNGVGIEPLMQLNIGQCYGIRPRNTVKGVFHGSPLACAQPEGWESRQFVTFDTIVYAHDTKINGGIFGLGDADHPDPFLFQADGNDYLFHIALTNQTLLDRVNIRLRFSQPSSLGLHRISIQLNTKSQEFQVFVDKKRVAASVETGKALSGYDRIARWEYSEFTIGSRCHQTHCHEVGGVIPSDYTVLGMRCALKLIYQTVNVNEAQKRIDGQQLTDADTLLLKNDDLFAGMSNFLPTGPALRILNKQNHINNGFLAPVSYATAGTNALSRCSISDLGIICFGEAYVNDAITLGAYLHLKLERLDIRRGFFNSIGTYNNVVSYPLFLNDCELGSRGSSFFGVNQSHIIANNITFGYVGRSAIRLSGCGSQWKNGITNDFEPYAEAFFLGYDYGIGAGHKFENIMIDTEYVRVSPRIAYFYLQKTPFVTNNGLELNRISAGGGSSPTIYLDDKNEHQLKYQGRVKIENCAFSNEVPLCVSTSSNWIGQIDTLKPQIGTQVVIAAGNHKIKTTHNDLSAPPNFGGWTKGAHEINIRNYVEGGPTKWVCSKSGIEGSESPPIWTCQTDNNEDKTFISGNIFSNFFARICIGTAKTDFAHFQDEATKQILDFILNGKTPDINLAKNVFIIDPKLVDKSLSVPLGDKESGCIKNDQTLWSKANNGTKTNLKEIVIDRVNATYPDMISETPSSLPSLITRDISFFMNSIDQGENYYQRRCLISGRFFKQPPNMFKPDAATIKPGDIMLGFSNRIGSWSTFAQNMILDYLFGYTNNTLIPASYQLGLGASLDPNTEYKQINRVNILRNGTFSPLDFGSTFVNNQVIQFTHNFGNIRPAPGQSNIVAQNNVGLIKTFFLFNETNNLIASGYLNRHVNILAGDTLPCFRIGSLQIQL